MKMQTQNPEADVTYPSHLLPNWHAMCWVQGKQHSSTEAQFSLNFNLEGELGLNIRQAFAMISILNKSNPEADFSSILGKYHVHLDCQI